MLGICGKLFKIHLGIFLQEEERDQQTVIDFANEAQCQHNAKILTIRSDNGTEFKNYTLDEFLSDEGIKHQYSAPYTPQQNGVAERKNWTLMDAARTMMAEFKSPYNFWAEAINTACHASNRLYLRKGLNKTPYEILPVTSPTSSTFECSGVSVSFSRKVSVCLNSNLELKRAYLLVMLQTLMLTVSSTSPPNSLRRRVTWSLMKITAPKWSKVVFVM